MILQAVVFDFDGVIIDTEKARYEAMQEIFTNHGQKLPLQVWIESVGRAAYAIDPFDYLESITGEKLDREILKATHKKIEMEMADALPLLPGVLERLEEVRNNGGLLAVASSSSRAWVQGHLQKRGLIKYFGAIVCRDDALRHKPHPEPYSTALKLLNCLPENSFAVEDSPLGIASAKAAGLKCIAVGCSLTRDMDLSGAHYVFNSLDEVCFSELCKRF